MLKRNEKKYVEDILNLLEEPDVIQLAKTVTLNKLVPKSAKESIDVILRYESSLKGFMQHKKVSREVLFQFMHYQKIPVYPKDDKRSMIIKILEYSKQRSRSTAKKEAKKTKEQNVHGEIINNEEVHIKEENLGGDNEYHQQQADEHQNLQEGVVNPQQPKIKEKNLSNEHEYQQQVIDEGTVYLNATTVKEENVSNEHDYHQQQIIRVASNGSLQPLEQYRRTEGNVNDLAVEFSRWFYSMINQGNQLGTEHFWDDTRTKLHILADGDIIEESMVEGAEESVQLLWETKAQHKLYFNPNITAEGVRGIVDVHGLVMVLACGSLHKEQKCVGLFEQKFGLIRDPTAGNNWKIKFTELFLRSTQTVKTLPTLQNAQSLALTNHLN